jgi:coenzyme F420-dependent glucose-6-phosphate dehydrogenase
VAFRIGYHLSSEEHPPRSLVANGSLAEELGFDSLSISDHFHPWSEAQGHSPFVWSVIGGLAHATERVEIGTLVTCPILRIHPAVIAHAAATAASMLPGRFFLGLGTGERLNEHVLGQHWPTAGRRQQMLEEAVEVIRQLWRGVLTSHHGEFFTVENARLYDVPEDPPPLYIAASGDDAAEVAGRLGDGLVALAPDADVLEGFRNAGGAGKPIVGMTHVCWADSRDHALDTVREFWPTSGIPHLLNAELPLPVHFDEAASVVPEEQISEKMVLGGDVDEHLDELRQYRDAGFDRLWVHQVGPEQEGFLRFYAEKILPEL